MHYVKRNMPGKRDRCTNCGKPMRRLYMQKNIATGSRGMVATGWFCEHCKFSDIISNFKESIGNSSLHPSLTCKCEACGGVHKKNSDIVNEDESVFMDDILKKLSGFVDSTFVPEKQVEGLIMINNIENASKYLGLVMGVFLCSSNEENQQIAKNVFKTNANHIQKELIDSVWKKSWKRKGWEPLHSDRFKKKIKDSSIDINQILGIGIILKHRITESTFKTIDLLDSPEIYIDAALKFNPHLTEEYAKRAINEKEKETALKYLVMAIKGGRYDLLKNYADLKGKEATEFILEQLEENKSNDSYDEPFYAALSKTGDPKAALLLVKRFCEEQNYSDRNCLLKIGNANSDDPLIKALSALQGSNFDVTEMITVLIMEMDNYKPIEFLLQYYKEPKEMALLFKEVIESSGDYEITKKFIRDAKGISSRYYKDYLLKKDPGGVKKFLFNDDSALRLMGLSMAESLDLDIELKEYIFTMSFLDSEETIRDGASELIKEKGLKKLTNIFNSKGDLSFNLPYGIKALEKLIDFEDPRFLPIILNHSNLNDVEEKVIELLKKLNPDNKETIEMLFQIAIERISGNSYRNEAPKNIIKIALDIDTKLSCKIIDNMKIEPTVFENIMGLIFQMSFTHSEESTRKGSTKLVKIVGVAKIKEIFDDEKETFNYWWKSKNWNGNTPFPESRQLENLKRLIDYDDSRFIPLIMKHIHVNGFDLEKTFLACLKRFNPNKNDLVEMLFETALEDAPQDKAKNAVMIALNVDKQKSYDKIRKQMKIVTGKDRSERKQSVNRRLMFITIFREMTTPDDIPYLRELMKKDRSPRVKKQLAQIIIEHT